MDDDILLRYEHNDDDDNTPFHETFERFVKTYENNFYLNYKRLNPDSTFFSYLQEIYFEKKQQLEDYKNLVARLNTSSNSYWHGQDIIDEKSKIVLFILEQINITAVKIQIEDEKTLEQVTLFKQLLQDDTTKLDEAPLLTEKQIDKIGLFVRSGIIEFLREKNEGIKDSDIARFIRELTSEPLGKDNSDSIRPHLTKNLESNKHPFYLNGRIAKLDLILKNYNISPQSDK